MTEFIIETKVYFADTDAAGIVYYGNYLRFLEIARCDYLESKGHLIADYHQQGISFVITDVHISYKSPAKLGDVLLISTKLVKKTNVRLYFEHQIKNKEDDRLIAVAVVRVACCFGSDLKPVRLPQSFDSIN